MMVITSRSLSYLLPAQTYYSCLHCKAWGPHTFGTALEEFPGTRQNGWFSQGSGRVEDTIDVTFDGHSFNELVGYLFA
jgi:hypothetical protein